MKRSLILFITIAFFISGCGAPSDKERQQQRNKEYQDKRQKAIENGAVPTRCKNLDIGGKVCLFHFEGQVCTYYQEWSTAPRGRGGAGGLSCYVKDTGLDDDKEEL